MDATGPSFTALPFWRFFVRKLFPAFRAPRARDPAEINIHPFYMAYQHRWNDLEPSLDKLVRAVARRHVRTTHMMRRCNEYAWRLTVGGVTQNNLEMIAAAIQEDVLLILEQDARRRDRPPVPEHQTARHGVQHSAGTAAPSHGGATARENVLHGNSSDPFNPTRPLFFRACLGKASAGKTKTRPPLLFDGEGRALLPEGLQMGMRSILYRGNEGMTSFLINPHLVFDDCLLEDHDVLPQDAPPELVLDLDLAIFARARDLLLSLKQRGLENRKVVCPLHYRSLAEHASAQRYLDALALLPADLRALLGFELHHLPKPWYAPALAPLLSPLRAHGCTLYARNGLDIGDAKSLADCGITGVGVNFSDIPESPDLPRRADKFIQSANRARLRTLACGLDTPSLLNTAKRAGFSRFSGDAVQIET